MNVLIEEGIIDLGQGGRGRRENQVAQSANYLASYRSSTSGSRVRTSTCGWGAGLLRMVPSDNNEVRPMLPDGCGDAPSAFSSIAKPKEVYTRST